MPHSKPNLPAVDMSSPSSPYSGTVSAVSVPQDGIDDIEELLVKLAFYPPRYRKPNVRQLICNRERAVYRLECSLDRAACALVTVPQPVPEGLEIIFLETKTRDLFATPSFDARVVAPGFVIISFYGEDIAHPERHCSGYVYSVMRSLSIGQDLVMKYITNDDGRKFLFPLHYYNLPRHNIQTSCHIKNPGSKR